MAALSKPIHPPPRAQSSLPARASVQLGIDDFGFAPGVLRQDRLHVPGVDGVKLESPGLSSGSSATPETRTSGHNVTPEGFPEHTGGSQRPVLDAIFPPPAPPLPPRKRRQRKPKPKPEMSVQEEEARRDVFLERNRVAASKCRRKKKEWTGDLEETRFDLESRNSHLQVEYRSLLDEVSRIKAQLMTHANCNDPNINKWIENEAKRFVLGAGERYDAMLATFDQAPLLHSRHESMSSVSEYTTSATNDLISPTTNSGSMSLPQGADMPNSPVFFRGQMSSDLGGRQMSTTELSYTIPRTAEDDDGAKFNANYMSHVL
ncbi:hypothetical protein BJ170DRAFT_687782 [Xylariales sp. AK1849]|nr:hypothetical protein BJ170DRAFT_687782 [Xylariales sp. AK1849]